MQIIEIIALLLVALSGCYLLVLGATSLISPAKANRFLLGFAGSMPVHFAELAIRLAVGAGFVIAGPKMMFGPVFNAFGWILLATTAVLLFVPWRWHQKFANKTVPQATRFIGLIGVFSIIAGVVVIWAIIAGRQM